LADLMKGAGFDWMSESLRVNPGAAMPVRHSDSSKAEPVRYSTMGEKTLANFQNEEQEPNGSAKEPTKKQYDAIAAKRANGETPEQVAAPTPINRGERSKVNADNATDENLVNSTANAIQADKGGNGVATQGTAPAVSGYDDILAMMRANTLNEGDMARRQHSREIVTGLGDLVSSIANLWATTKGAPSSYDNSKGMTATSQSRYDRELARRKAQNEQILNYYRVKKAAEDDERIRKYREDIDAREQRRLDEAERHDKEMERLAAEKEQNNKEAKAEDQERKNKDSENKRNNDNKRTNAYVAGQNKKGKGSTKKSSKSSSSNTPPSRRRGNSNGNNTRPSKRK
jgi:hypothetical protein